MCNTKCIIYTMYVCMYVCMYVQYHHILMTTYHMSNSLAIRPGTIDHIINANEKQ